jgi:hypothetical protein
MNFGLPAVPISVVSGLLLITFLPCGCIHRHPVIAGVPTPGISSNPTDAIWKTTNANRFPENPEWGTQTQNPLSLPPPSSPTECTREPYKSPCSSQFDPPNPTSGRIDVPVPPNLLICSLEPAAKVHGHVNWTLAEFTGALVWAGIAFDADYNFALIPPDSKGLTEANESLFGHQYIEAEFASSETGDQFQTKWWSDFRNAVENTVVTHDDSAVQTLITPSSGNLAQTVVQGLFGMDCEHDCHSEVHPVYALAIEVEDKGDDNTWAIFVRNWGNEGFCSQFDHQLMLPSNQFTIFLPRLSTGTPERLPSTEFQASDSTIKYELNHTAGLGTNVTFNLPAPGTHPLAELILRMKWSNDTYTGPPLAIRAPQHIPTQLEIPEAEREKSARDGEEYLNALLLKKPPLTQIPIRPAPPRPNVFQGARPPLIVEQPQGKPNPNQGAPAQVQSRAIPDKEKALHDRCAIRRLCESYNWNPPSDRIPKLPQICAKLRRSNECDALPGR